MELGNGLIGHLLSRPNPTLSPFAPVIRRRRPANNTSPLLSSPFFFFFFLLSLPRFTRDACTRILGEEGDAQRSMRERKVSPLRVPLARSTRTTTGQLMRGQAGETLPYGIFDRRLPGESLLQLSRWRKWLSRRVAAFSGCIIGKLFERSFEEQFFFRFFSSLVCFLLFSYLDRSRVGTKLQTRNTIGR